MVELQSANVRISRSCRRKLMGWLKRVIKIGERLGSFFLHINVHRVGKQFEVHADVIDKAGAFHCRQKQRTIVDAFRELVRTLKAQLRQQELAMVQQPA